jgi:fructose transport system substrate-binding protein
MSDSPVRARTLRFAPVAGATLALALVGGATAQSPSADTSAAPGASGLPGEGVLIGLITKDNTNPFFVKMHEGAQAKAAELGAELTYIAGTSSADNDTQVTGIESLISAGADGILLTASDSTAIVPSVEAAKAAGILVIALDTALNPADAAQATFATDNFLAGQLIGRWAAGHMGEDAVTNAKIALINDTPAHATVDVQRNQGFLDGFGVDIVDPLVIGDESDPRIVGQDVSNGQAEGGRTAMENLLSAHPDITVVHTINEPTASGAYLALQAAGVEDTVTMVSVDGGCPGVQAIADGTLGATAMQFPLLMASLGVEAVVEYAQSGTLPPPSEGLDFFNTGVNLITDQPVEDLESQDSAWGLENCWG